jgi:glutamine kinase
MEGASHNWPVPWKQCASISRGCVGPGGIANESVRTLDTVLCMTMVDQGLRLRSRQADQPPGQVFWITGFSGAGKTTIGRQLWSRLRTTGRPAVFLDGDALRQVIAEDLGHGADDRRRSAMRNARICQAIAAQGMDVVCATISLFHAVHRWNRTNIPGYTEIYLRVPLEELMRRDEKGIYERASRGELANVVGLDLPAEEPEAPDLVLDNYGKLDPAAAVDAIWSRLIAPECGAPARVTRTVEFGTKAETLARLAPLLRAGHVLPQVRFTVADWQRDPGHVLAHVGEQDWGSGPLIVRSSAIAEDGPGGSQAGKYDSVAGVVGRDALVRAVETVIASFQSARLDDQVLIQPMLTLVRLAGVAFTRDPNGGGPYYVINYDDSSGRTDAVTSGAGGELKTFFCLKSGQSGVPPHLRPVVELLRELERLLGHDAIDVEFAVGARDDLYLLQVRPLAIALPSAPDTGQLSEAVADIACKVELLSRPHPYLHGTRSVFGIMPDWNPAEIIGLRPRPLALSMYRELVTDAIWAYQRDNYGYKNLRSFPLLVSFHGRPYIDVRVSFNSFVPRDIGGPLAERLVNHYIDRLLAQPNLHDKVEFEIVFSCYTPDLPERLRVLGDYGFSHDDRETITESLRDLTNRIINGATGLWCRDREKIDILTDRLPNVQDASIDKISRIYWLLEDCKRYGTLPFAGLARAGFIAVQLLRSLVTVGVLDGSEYASFMANLDTVGSRIGRDFAHLPKEEFLRRYGHLRPGTYDILSPSYDESPDLYFAWSSPRPTEPVPPRFALSVAQLRSIEQLLKEHRLEHDVLGLIEFIKAGIESREYAKFVFTRSLSAALSLIRQLGEEHGLSVEDCSFLDLAVVRSLYSESGCVAARLRESAARGMRCYELTRSLVLPPVIAAGDNLLGFHLPPTQPNFITQCSITAPVSTIDQPPETLAGTVLFIPSADPGFDWIFTRGISGFVTQFGGVNSHMAIRAGELGVPAVIGAGEAHFQRWRAARVVHLDCASRQVQVVT